MVECPKCKKKINLNDIKIDGLISEYKGDDRLLAFGKEIYITDIHADNTGISGLGEKKYKNGNKWLVKDDLVMVFQPLIEHFKRMPFDVGDKIKVILLWSKK